MNNIRLGYLWEKNAENEQLYRKENNVYVYENYCSEKKRELKIEKKDKKKKQGYSALKKEATFLGIEMKKIGKKGKEREMVDKRRRGRDISKKTELS